MGTFLNLFLAASMPVVKVLLITTIGLFLALNRIDILGPTARHHMNRAVFYVFTPALVGSNLAKTFTFKTFISLWFMPVNILITFLVGSALGWVLGKVTRAPKHIKGLILASCSAGNLGNLIIIIVPAICTEKASPFGAPDLCNTYGLAYATLSMAIGNIYIWLYTYNIVRISSKEVVEDTNANGYGIQEQPNIETVVNVTGTERLPSAGQPLAAASQEPNGETLDNHPDSSFNSVPLSLRIRQWLKTNSKKINFNAVLAPSTIGAMFGFFIGTIPPLKKLLTGNDAPLHVVGDTASMLGDACIPCMTLILGANLLRGLKGCGVKLKVIVGIIVVRYMLLPLLGIFIVKGAVRAGLVQSHDLLFQFILLLQYALPPAMSIGTITQLFGAGQSEFSVITLWTYTLASVALTLWSTFFLWLLVHER